MEAVERGCGLLLLLGWVVDGTGGGDVTGVVGVVTGEVTGVVKWNDGCWWSC